MIQKIVAFSKNGFQNQHAGKLFHARSLYSYCLVKKDIMPVIYPCKKGYKMKTE